MTVLLARLKQAAKWAWALLAFAAAATFGVMLYRMRKQGNSLSAPDPIDRAIAKYTRTTDEATYRAAVEIAAGQEKDLAVQAELIDVLRKAKTPGEEDAQIDKMIAVGKRVRGERP